MSPLWTKGKPSVPFRRGIDSYEYKDYVLDLIRKEPEDLAKVYAMASEYITGDNALRAMRLTRQREHHEAKIGQNVPKEFQYMPKEFNNQHKDKKHKNNGSGHHSYTAQDNASYRVANGNRDARSQAPNVDRPPPNQIKNEQGLVEALRLYSKKSKANHSLRNQGP